MIGWVFGDGSGKGRMGIVRGGIGNWELIGRLIYIYVL